MAYIVNIGGQSFGPAELDELREWHRAGAFSPADFVWDDHQQTWIEAGSFAATAPIFLRAPVPARQVDETELPPPEIRERPSEITVKHCYNHELEKATEACPKCRRSFCMKCMMPSASGLMLCINCVADDKGAATRGGKRTSLMVGAVVLVFVILIAAFSLFGNETVEQPLVPERIELKRSARRVPEPVIEDLIAGDTTALGADTAVTPAE